MHTQLTKIVTVINELNHLRGYVKKKLRHHVSLMTVMISLTLNDDIHVLARISFMVLPLNH